MSVIAAGISRGDPLQRAHLKEGRVSVRNTVSLRSYRESRYPALRRPQDLSNITRPATERYRLVARA
jgi:hypothetical protein